MTDAGLPRATVARMFEEMVQLQEQHNHEVDPGWREAGFAYYRAVWVECAELLDHFGWKWWKKQTPDLAQVRLELVDIWHFGLSMLLRDGFDRDAVIDLLHGELGGQRDAQALRTDVEALAAAALTDHRFSMQAFIDCLNAIAMDMTALYETYVGKNVLNNFRQHHGYQDGSYRKLWAGREDNEHLVEVLALLDAAADDFQAQLYAALEARYADSAAS